MKLRHKKPLNPYKGQANNDKNEINDDDFRQQGSPHKKYGNAPSDQIFKYARILAKFVKTINQDYRAAQGNPDQPEVRLSSEQVFPEEKPNISIQPPLDLPQNQQLKEKKQIRKLQIKIDPKQDHPQIKATPRKRENLQPPPLNQEPRPSPPPPPQELQKVQPNTLKPKVEPKEKEAPKVQNGKEGVINQNELKKMPVNGQSMGMGPGMGMNNFMGMQGMQGMQGLQGMQNMMNQNQMLAQMAMIMSANGGNVNQMQLAQMLMRYNNPSLFYGGYPMNMAMMNGMNGMGGMNNSFLYQQPNRMTPNPNLRPVPNLFNQQFNSFKANPNPAPQDTKTVYPLKRAAFHAAIAYKIYLDKLKQKGCSFDSPDDIDPTKSARKVKSDQTRNNTMKKKK